MPKQPRSLNSKVIAVTGGARGIGRAAAVALLGQGARVAVGDLDGDLSRHVAGELGTAAIGLPLDVTSRESFVSFLDHVEGELGPLDVLVNNAAIAPAGEFVREPDALTARVFAVNLGGMALGSKLALERMLPRSTGHIVNVASALGRAPAPGGVSYCASKHAIVGLSEALRTELEGSGVEVHLVLPGLVHTEMAMGLKGLRGIRTLEPEEVAAAIVEVLQAGRNERYVPRLLGPVVAMRPLTPRPVVRLLERLIGSDRLFTQVDTLERAAYEARIRPPGEAAQADPAATVANAAASVADALRGREATRD